MPRIVDAHAHFRVADDVEVVFGEIGGDDLRHERLDLGDRLVLDRRIDRHGAGGDARAAADDEHFLRACSGMSVVRWPSMRCSRMSCGSLDAWTLPAL